MMGLKPEVADTDKSARQHVEEEATHEVGPRQSNEAGGVAAAPIAIAKGHRAVFERHQALVADGDAMGVATEVAQDLLRSRHGRLAVDDPLLGGRLLQQAPAQGWTRYGRVRGELAFEGLEQLAAEDAREGPHRHQEARASTDPALLQRIQAAAGDDAVEVGMEAQRLGPGVQHGDGARYGSQPPSAHGMERT